MSKECFHILLVEDNEADVYILRKALANTGLSIQITVLEDGAQALAFAQKEGHEQNAQPPDLVVLDLNVPKKSGLEVLQGLRHSRYLSAVPVIILSSYASPEEKRAMEQLGVLRVLIKPPNLDSFLRIGAIISEVLLNPGAGKATS